MSRTALQVVGGRPLRGRIRVPGDKSISHRALVLGSLARGRSVVRGLSPGGDVGATAVAVRSLGARVGRGGSGEVTVTGGRLREPAAALEVGNSGTAARLLAGLVSAFPWLTVIQGDESVNARPMDRVVAPLRLMGAEVDGRDEARHCPIVVRGGALHGIDYTPPVASAQVKGAVLLAGLGAEGETVVREPLATRAHTEEMLADFGAEVEVEAEGTGKVVRLRQSRIEPFSMEVPGDPSQAAFWVVAACTVPGSEVVVEDVYVGSARTGFLDVLSRMGASVEVRPHGDRLGDIVALYSSLHGTEVGGDEVPGLIDEIPVLAVAAALAEGTTVFRGAEELRLKESDRIESVVGALASIGARAEPLGDGLIVEGVPRLGGGKVESKGDHRVAMSMAVAGLSSREPTEVGGFDAVSTSYPGFERDLELLAASG